MRPSLSAHSKGRALFPKVPKSSLKGIRCYKVPAHRKLKCSLGLQGLQSLSIITQSLNRPKPGPEPAPPVPFTRSPGETPIITLVPSPAPETCALSGVLQACTGAGQGGTQDTTLLAFPALTRPHWLGSCSWTSAAPGSCQSTRGSDRCPLILKNK